MLYYFDLCDSILVHPLMYNQPHQGPLDGVAVLLPAGCSLAGDTVRGPKYSLRLGVHFGTSESVWRVIHVFHGQSGTHAAPCSSVPPWRRPLRLRQGDGMQHGLDTVTLAKNIRPGPVYREYYFPHPTIVPAAV
jgi:hypothetical protein